MEFVDININNFAERSREWERYYLQNKYFNLECKITDTILLVIDMQDYFLERSSPAYFKNAELILDNINNLIDFARRNNIKIIYTLQENKKNDNMSSMERWWKYLPRDIKHRLHKGIQLSESPDIVVKETYSAFVNTNLEESLKIAGIKNIIICGIKTNLCCETTARDAFLRNFNVVIVADATITNNEFMQVASLVNLSYGFAKIIYGSQVDTLFTHCLI